MKVNTYKLKKDARNRFWVLEEIVRHFPSEIYATSQGLKELVHDSSKCTRNRKTGENSMLLFFFKELATAVESHVVHLILRYCSYKKNLDLTHINDIYWVFFFLQ